MKFGLAVVADVGADLIVDVSAAFVRVVLTGWLDGVVKLAGARYGVWVYGHDG